MCQQGYRCDGPSPNSSPPPSNAHHHARRPLGAKGGGKRALKMGGADGRLPCGFSSNQPTPGGVGTLPDPPQGHRHVPAGPNAMRAREPLGSGGRAALLAA